MKKGWKGKNIGEVCKVIAGQSPEGKFYNKNGDGLPFYQGKKEFSYKFIGEPTTWTTKVTKEAIENDILMSVRAPVGPVNFSTQRICIGRGLAAIRANGQLDKDFLFNFLVKHENEITGNTGAVFNSINKSQIEAIEIPLPPLPEQKRIVKILDKAFQAIDKAKENAEKNLQNAKELFESYLNGIFANPGEDWEIKKLGEVIATSQIGLVRNSEEQSPEFSYRYFKMNNIRNDNGLNENSFTFVEATKEDVEKYCLKNRDFLFNTRNSYELVGKTCLYQSDYKEPTLFNNNILRVTFNKYLLSQFVAFAFSSNQIKEELERMKSGTTSVVGIYYKSLKNLKIPIPPLPEQKSIVSKLDALLAETKRLEKIYQQKIADTEELKKSILQKAFEGGL